MFHSKKQLPKHRVKFTNNNSGSYSNDNNNSNYQPQFRRTYSHEGGASEFHAHHKKRLNHRRNPRSRHRKNQTVKSLWFRAQNQLKQGRNPAILSKYNITLTNIRQHHPRYKDHIRRKSHHEKAATYLQVTGGRMHTNKRGQIDNDDDEAVSDDPECDVGYYASTNGYDE